MTEKPKTGAPAGVLVNSAKKSAGGQIEVWAKKGTGEKAEMLPAGTSPEVLRAGTITLDATSRAAQGNIALIVSAAQSLGIELPLELPLDPIFLAGQVFYKQGKPIEARLALLIPVQQDAATGTDPTHTAPGWKEWTTPTPPKISFQDGQLSWDPKDTNRCHLSAVIAQNDDDPTKVDLVLLFDLRDNAGALVARREIMPAQIAIGANFPGDRDFHRALMLKHKNGVWGINENEGSMFSNGKNCVTQYKPPEIFPEWWYQTREATLGQLDKRFREMRSELTADVIDILFHHWYQHRNPQKQEKAAITLSQLCEYRGIQPQKKNLAALWEAMRDARSFRLIGDGIDAALFEMDAALNLWGIDEPPRADVVYFYSPGFFLAQAIKENPIYLAPYVRKIWELDPYRDGIAKRLARYLRSEWRMNTQKYLRPKDEAPGRYRTWQSILDDAGVDVAEYLDSKNPIRLKEDVEAALDTLFDIEAIAEFNATIYHPDDRRLLDNLPRKGAMKAWLQLRLCIDPPAEVSDALQEPNAKRIARAIEAKAAALEAKKPRSAPKKGPKSPPT
jgi:hypothetical protein